MNEQDLENTLIEFFLKDSVVFFFLLHSLIYQSTDFINLVQQIINFELTKTFINKFATRI